MFGVVLTGVKTNGRLFDYYGQCRLKGVKTNGRLFNYSVERRFKRGRNKRLFVCEAGLVT